MRRLLLRSILLLGGLILGIVAVEVGLRIAYPDGGMVSAHLQTFTPETLDNFRADPECGYLPVTGGSEYGPEGCLHNNYDVKDRKGRTRLLFVGDSATHRGRIIDALKALYGEEKYEYWNAGVESFNTLQELVLYRRYNATIQPAHVILTFHNNDFLATPLVFREKGVLKVFVAGKHLNPWLFEHSYIYRWAWPRTETGDRADRAAEVLHSLEQLKSILGEKKIRFSVLLLPILKPLPEWGATELWSRQQSIADFEGLGIRYFDLLGDLEAAQKEGTATQESPGDTWHPNQALAERFAKDLQQRRLLEKD